MQSILYYINIFWIGIWYADPSWVLPSLQAGEASCVCYRYFPLASWFKTRLYSGHICSDDRYKSGTFEPYLLSSAWTWHALLVHYIEQFWWQQHLDSFKSWVYECINRKLESKFPLIQKQSWSNCPPYLHHLTQRKWLSFFETSWFNDQLVGKGWNMWRHFFSVGKYWHFQNIKHESSIQLHWCFFASTDSGLNICAAIGSCARPIEPHCRALVIYRDTWGSGYSCTTKFLGVDVDAHLPMTMWHVCIYIYMGVSKNRATPQTHQF